MPTCLSNFPGLLDMPDDVVFIIHYNGVFKYDPPRPLNWWFENEIKKKDACSMFVDELVAWAKEEANSPYLRYPPLKSRSFRNDMKGKVLFIGMYCPEDEGFEYYPLLNDDEVGKDNLVLRSCDLENEGMNDDANCIECNDVVDGRIQCVEVLNDAANYVSIYEEVISRQNKLDKGKRPMIDDDIVT
ncbi:hypothetical protein Tco_0931277, partial [Tanacetum coccineum]